ncbi:MAG: nucleotidyl transferase AbiEii/AbiGii toxin family protein [Thermoguttaceae bacterium]
MNSDSHLCHEDIELFREALAFTQSETGFSARLIEKDYYGSLLLHDMLATTGPQWAFKGGTCLSKVHSDFYRMSEDLDFAYSVPLSTTRSHRSKMIAAMKEHVAELAQRLACFKVVAPLRGYNNSTQYTGSLCYKSAVTAQDEPIKVEFSIREPVLDPVERLPARTLLINPLRQAEALAAVRVPVLSCRETYCEKLRAALTRREPAIRDFYDIDYGVRSGRFCIDDPRVIDLVCSKLAVSGNHPIDVSHAKHQVLARQVKTQLRPVLREADYTAFDLERVFGIVVQVATSLR